jgi:hypothetical protein
MKMRRKNPAKAVEAWNAKHPIGTAVTVLKDNDEAVTGETRSEAFVLSGHSAVIFVTGVSGCYALERVKAVRCLT